MVSSPVTVTGVLFPPLSGDEIGPNGQVPASHHTQPNANGDITIAGGGISRGADNARVVPRIDDGGTGGVGGIAATTPVAQVRPVRVEDSTPIGIRFCRHGHR